MEYFTSVLVVLLAVVATGFAQTDYCKISRRHTMCRFRGIGPSCRGNPLARGLSVAEKNAIVKFHNNFRAKVANGLEGRGSPEPQPPASNMLELRWDEELAAVAQRWADQCNFAHDENRNVGRFQVGQNIFMAMSSNRGPVDWNQAVKAWYDEVAMVDRNVVDSYSFSVSTGHYTQVVWATTATIGCGMVTFRDSKWFKNYIVCNYGPSGNWMGAKMYQKGRACSACPSGTSCSRTNRGLCADRRFPSNVDGNEFEVDLSDSDDSDVDQDSRDEQAFGRHFGRGRFFPPFVPFFPLPLPPPPFIISQPLIVVNQVLPSNPPPTASPAPTSVTPVPPSPSPTSSTTQSPVQPPPPPSSYCNISLSHTMCKFQGFGPSCGTRSARGVDDAGKKAIVSLHNKLRARVAKGQETRGKPGPQPSASNMLELHWDDELAQVAQQWADQCVFGHDDVRRVSRFEVGQNVFQTSSPLAVAPDWNQTVQAWYNEVDNVDPSIVGQYSFSKDTGHYTQMVWATTSLIGCGMITYTSGNSFNNLIVCNYGAGGNVITSKMYDTGAACSACPAGTTCSQNEPGLCSDGRQPLGFASNVDSPRDAHGWRHHRDRFFPPWFPVTVFPLPPPPFILPSVVPVVPQVPVVTVSVVPQVPVVNVQPVQSILVLRAAQKFAQLDEDFN